MSVAVLTTLLTSHVDPQRGAKWPADIALLDELLSSLARHNVPAVVLHDELENPERDGVEFFVVNSPGGNPYFRRWHAIAEFLELRPYIDSVWCVDGTDVEMLHNPFPHMEGDTIYVGSEPSTLMIPWLLDLHPSAGPLAAMRPDGQLVNAGLLGGRRLDVARFARRVVALGHPGDHTDMGAFNVSAHLWPGPIVTGSMVHTVFRANDRTGSAWWRHK